MDQTKLQYGDAALNLTKSKSLVAIKPAQGQSLRATVARHGGQTTGQAIGGFQVVHTAQPAEAMEATLDELREEEAIEVGTHVYHTSDDGVPFVPTGQIYLVLKNATDLDEGQKLIEALQLEIVEVRGERELIVEVTENSPNPVKVAAALQQSPLVAVAEPELASPGKLTLFALPGDGLLAQQWHLRNTGKVDGSPFGLKAGADARVVEAWKLAKSLGTRDAIVAVIDDGFDLSHPDLTGAGKVVAPWDFTRGNNDPQPGFSASYPFFDASQNSWVGDWHGTACAGVAVGNAGAGSILGVAPHCRLLPVRWGIDLADAQVEAWFNYVRQQGAWVVSCSWSAAAQNFPLSTRKQQAIARCAREGRNGLGCVICFAAGNENRDINDPASASVNGFAIHPDVIAVAASTSRDEKAHYSNFGAAIAVCAPSSGAGGRRIVTADVLGTFLRNGQAIEAGYGPGAYTFSFGGTSSSTPLVAGVCALLLSINPTLTAAQVKALIQQTARKIGPANAYDANGHAREFGYGCIDAVSAVKRLRTVAAKPAVKHATPRRRVRTRTPLAG
jgi:subtilisin family serine protease